MIPDGGEPSIPRMASVDERLASSAPRTSGPLEAVRTTRLELTPIEASSVEPLAQVFAKDEVWRYPFSDAVSAATRPRRSWSARSTTGAPLGFGLWLATVRDEESCIGFVGLSVPTFLPSVLPAVEVGWRLDPDAWGRGYATEAATAALQRAFEVLELDQVTSLPQVDNPRSVAVAERIGMQLERIETAPPTDRRGPVDVAVMVITHQAWSLGTAGLRG